LGIADVEDELFALLKSQIPEAVPQPVDRLSVGASLVHDTDAIDAAWLRSDAERHGEKTDGENDRESDRPHGHLGWRMAGGESSRRWPDSLTDHADGG
jgi:hypothetical protein